MPSGEDLIPEEIQVILDHLYPLPAVLLSARYDVIAHSQAYAAVDPQRRHRRPGYAHDDHGCSYVAGARVQVRTPADEVVWSTLLAMTDAEREQPWLDHQNYATAGR